LPNPRVYVAPGLTLNQWEYNTKKFGDTMWHIPWWMTGYKYPVWWTPKDGWDPTPPLFPGPISMAPSAGPAAAPPALGPSPGSGGSDLQGAADLLRAQTEFLAAQRHAELARDRSRHVQPEPRRRGLEGYLAEPATQPAPKGERAQREEVRRSLNDPPLSEVLSGKALNDLLTHLLRSESAPQAVPLAEDVVGKINVTGGRGDGNLGVLKNHSRSAWPAAVQRLANAKADRERFDAQLSQAVHQAVSVRLDVAVLKELEGALDRLEAQVAGNVADLSPAQYLEARRYLNGLRSGLKVLQRPDAAQYLLGENVARGATVAELVRHMAERGMQFAPATTGDEAAYVALHRAFVAACRPRP
jgi:hypothetical protein